MGSANPPAFVHRENRDGATESICRACYVTVCTSIWEADLDSAEKTHVCDPGLLARWNRIAGRKPGKEPQP